MENDEEVKHEQETIEDPNVISSFFKKILFN